MNSAEDIQDKKIQLSRIMGKACTLVDLAWPRDDCNVSPMPREAELLLIDIQEQAAKALGLPKGLPLMTGDRTIDLD
jgi:hypothetical protein